MKTSSATSSRKALSQKASSAGSGRNEDAHRSGRKAKHGSASRGASSAGSNALVPQKRPREQQGLEPEDSSPPPKQRKSCPFLCGAICFETKDPCNKNRDSIRWAYDSATSTRSSGEGQNDWYCERAWAAEAASSGHRDRAQYQSDLSKDRDMLSRFLERRRRVIERAVSKGTSERSRRRAGLSRVSVQTSEFKKRFLQKPPDDFWPLPRYRKKFGSPSRKENRALGHKKAIFEGHAGVVVPGDDGLGPWKICTEEGRQISKNASEDVGSSGGRTRWQTRSSKP